MDCLLKKASMPIHAPHANFDSDELHEGIGLYADVPLGNQPLQYYKNIAVTILAQQIVELIEPEFIETEGFELMRYPIVVIRNGEDGRNHVKIPEN